MVEFFKTVDGRITEVSEFTEGCWVNMVHPSSDELEQIAQAAQVEEEFVRAALDPEESSRVDTEDEQLLMIVDIPMVEKSSVEDGGQMFTTIPMGIVVAQNAVITVCLEDSIILRSIAEGAVKGVHTSLKTRFVFQILLRIAGRFLKNLRMIERDFTRIEKRLYDSLKNEELIQLLGLSKSLVYFSSSLKGNEVTMEKVLRGRVLKLYEDDRDILEDALIDLDFLGLHNVLALRGDKSQNEKFFMPHPQGHSHAVDLVRQIAAMNRGEFVDGEVEECHHSKFSIGVAGYPEGHEESPSPEADIAALKAKIDAGAGYIVTQLFYDNARFFDFVRRCREAGIAVPIIPGIKPLSTLRHLTLLPQTFGCRIPEELEREVLRHREDPKAIREVGTEWAVAQSRELKQAGVPVLHYYPMGKADNIIKIAKAIF